MIKNFKYMVGFSLVIGLFSGSIYANEKSTTSAETPQAVLPKAESENRKEK